MKNSTLERSKHLTIWIIKSSNWTLNSVRREFFKLQPRLKFFLEFRHCFDIFFFLRKWARGRKTERGKWFVQPRFLIVSRLFPFNEQLHPLDFSTDATRLIFIPLIRLKGQFFLSSGARVLLTWSFTRYKMRQNDRFHSLSLSLSFSGRAKSDSRPECRIFIFSKKKKKIRWKVWRISTSSNVAACFVRGDGTSERRFPSGQCRML